YAQKQKIIKEVEKYTILNLVFLIMFKGSIRTTANRIFSRTFATFPKEISEKIISNKKAKVIGNKNKKNTILNSLKPCMF
ncbi:MAG TPA: hypothetical protein VKN14_06170, partial [Flavobacteriaceae bacterium]|nr:hypothetical protein [Flavobacteriaceae bacterium]